MEAGILLCAGFGTRLKPVTDSVPKPAVPFLGHPMVWYAMRAMRDAGITALAANVHHLPDRMSDALARCARSLDLPVPAIYTESGEILGTGGGARECARLLPDADRFVIHHGDVLCHADLRRALDEHVASGADVSLILAPRPENSKLGMIGVDAQNRVAQIRDWKRPDAANLRPACFTGIHIVERRVLESLPRDIPVCLVTETYRARLERGLDIHAIPTAAFFADIGTPETYFAAQTDVMRAPGLLPGADPSLFVADWNQLCYTMEVSALHGGA